MEQTQKREENIENIDEKMCEDRIVLFNPKAGDCIRYTSRLRCELLKDYDLIDYIFVPKHVGKDGSSLYHVDFQYGGRTFYVSPNCRHFKTNKFIYNCSDICIPGLVHQKIAEPYLSILAGKCYPYRPISQKLYRPDMSWNEKLHLTRRYENPKPTGKPATKPVFTPVSKIIQQIDTYDTDLKKAIELSVQEYTPKVPSHLCEYVPKLSLEESMIVQAKIQNYKEYLEEKKEEPLGNILVDDEDMYDEPTLCYDTDDWTTDDEEDACWRELNDN